MKKQKDCQIHQQRFLNLRKEANQLLKANKKTLLENKFKNTENCPRKQWEKTP